MNREFKGGQVGLTSVRALRHWMAPILGATVVAIVSGTVFYVHAYQPDWGNFQSDLVNHLEIARRVLSGEQTIPHPGFHYLVGAASSVTGFSFAGVAVALLTICNVATYAVTVSVLRRHGGATMTLAAGTAVLVSLAAAIYVPWFTTNMYRGHGTPNVWHSPTWVAMQPLALGSFLALLEWHRSASRRALALFSAALALSVAVKPSWAVVLLPVLAVVAIPHLRLPTWWHLPLGVAPAVILLGTQLVVTGGGEGGGVAVEPWTVWASKTPSVLLSVLIVMAFPIVAIVVGRHEMRWRGFSVALGIWATAFLQRAFLVEPARPSHGNWSWGYFIALKVMFIVGAVVAVRAGRWRWPAVILLLHAVAGILYIVRLVSGGGYA